MAVVGSANAFELGVGGGVFIPMDDNVSDVYDAGYSADLYADFHIALPVTLRVLGLYYSADGELLGVSQRLQAVGGGAMLMLKPELGAVQPYIGVGYSMMSIKSGSHNSHYQNNSHNTNRDTANGVIGQVGVDFPLGQLAVGINAKYFMANTDADVDFGGLTAGLNLGYRF